MPVILQHVTQGVAGQEGVDRPMTHARTLRKPLIAGRSTGAAPASGSCRRSWPTCGSRPRREARARVHPGAASVAEFGASWLLPRIVGTANTMDLLLSGRPVTAEEALTMGLVSTACTRPTS